MSAATTWGGHLVGIETSLTGAERRRTPRYGVRGSAEALIRRPDGSAALTAITLIDSSATGLGLVSRVAAEPGDEINIHWDHSPLSGRRGIVARCEPVETESGETAYRLGLRAAAVAAA